MGSAKLSATLGVSVDEAKKLIKDYLGTMKQVKKLKQACEGNVRDLGYVETVFGRRRYFNKAFSGKDEYLWAAYREGLNHKIQGTCADIIKLAMININKELSNNSLKSMMVLQVHDELVFDVHPDELDIVAPLVKKCMEGAVNFIVPMISDGKYGDSWGESH